MNCSTLRFFLVLVVCWYGAVPAAWAAEPARLLSIEGTVQLARAPGTNWTAAVTNALLHPGDRLRTGERSRAAVRLPDLSVQRLAPRTTLTIEAPVAGKSSFFLNLGELFFKSFGPPKDHKFGTRSASGAIRGTEFRLAVDEAGLTVLTLLDGKVDLENAAGRVELNSGEEATVAVGQAPRKAPALFAQRAVQWCLYYPGVLDVDEAPLDAAARAALAASIAAYRAGDLRGALDAWPAGRAPASPGERVFLAAVLLGTGQIVEAAPLLAEPAEGVAGRLAAALRQVVAVVQLAPVAALPQPALATEWLAESYREQAAGTNENARLAAALVAARTAAEVRPQFGFAHARVAELEFGFGRRAHAEAALAHAREHSPRNAQVLALGGFLASGAGRFAAAAADFERAIALDPALGNAWLGRGLVRIRQGDAAGGREDLHVAATLEPNRALLRSYLAKAHLHLAQRTPVVGARTEREELRQKAGEELALATRLDAADPTSWLYSALLNYQRDRIADAIRDLEKSVTLNDNRALYRSRFLLDQDQAVRSANLANIYESAGMREVGLRESARSVMFDYANFSAHLNLASSYNALRDPTRFNLRNEAEWSSESLIASLLAPPGAGTLSQNYSQNEYSQAFAAPRLGINSTTEYFSDAREVRQTTAQFGHTDTSAYAFDLDYITKEGVRVNNDLSRIDWYTTIKQQLTAADSVLVRVKYQDFEAGDNFQYLDPASARPNRRSTSAQEPILVAGWHREWAPGVHTLALGGRFLNEQTFTDKAVIQTVAFTPAGSIDPEINSGTVFDVDQRSRFETWSGEVQQIFQREHHTDIFGGRVQRGQFDATHRLSNGAPLFGPLPFVTSGDGTLERQTLYAYHNWEVGEGLLLTGGAAYDRLVAPRNFRRGPLTAGEFVTERWLPKAAVIYHPRPDFVARAAYARALGGVSFDESIRLEPTQLAGFSQSFRTLISESVAGSVEAPTYDVFGAGVDFKLRSRTYFTIEALDRRQRVDRQTGILLYNLGNNQTTPGSTDERLRFKERSVVLTVNQILAPNVFLEAQYRLTDSRLQRDLPTLPATATFPRTTILGGTLQQWRAAVLVTLPESFFARAEATWWDQNGRGALTAASDAFPQVNLLAGWRFPNRRGEVAVGLLNATGQDYRLSPINYYTELPRERTLYTRLRFSF